MKRHPLIDKLLWAADVQDVTMVELARRAKVSRSQLWRFATGREQPKLWTLSRLAAAVDLALTLTPKGGVRP